jgi:hypothetical protein
LDRLLKNAASLLILVAEFLRGIVGLEGIIPSLNDIIKENIYFKS